MTEQLRKNMKRVGGWILLHLIILLAYIPAHIAWGDPLDSPSWYRPFSLIIGIFGGWVMRGRNILFALIPAFVAHAEGAIVYFYAYRTSPLYPRPAVMPPGAYFERTSFAAEQATEEMFLIALGWAVAVMTVLWVIKRISRSRS